VRVTELNERPVYKPYKHNETDRTEKEKRYKRHKRYIILDDPDLN